MRRLVTIGLAKADLAAFEAYEAKVLPLVDRHGGALEFRVRALDGSSETHLLRFPDIEAYDAYRADPARQAVQDEWRACGATASAVEVETVASGATPAGRLIDHAWAVDFAKKWVSAWNDADLERILSHYTDDFEMASPLIRERMGVASGRLKGKAAVRPYWALGLAGDPPLRFELLDVLAGMDVVAISYRSATRGRRVIERLQFNEAGLVTRAEALYCDDR